MSEHNTSKTPSIKSSSQDQYGKKPLQSWSGKVVSFDSQKDQIDSGWGWRYKVRILGDNSNVDNVSDGELSYAFALLPTTAGSGGAYKLRSARISQGDMVYGIRGGGGPTLILGVFPRTREAVTTAGFTANVKKGLAPVEISEQGGAPIPVLNDNKNTKGPTNPKETPKEKLQKEMGLDPEAPVEKDSVPDPDNKIFFHAYNLELEEITIEDADPEGFTYDSVEQKCVPIEDVENELGQEFFRNPEAFTGDPNMYGRVGGEYQFFTEVPGLIKAANGIPRGPTGEIRGLGGPKDDLVGPFMLSDQEYVLPKEMVMATGGGNYDTGIKKLENMRKDSLNKYGDFV